MPPPGPSNSGKKSFTSRSVACVPARPHTFLVANGKATEAGVVALEDKARRVETSKRTVGMPPQEVAATFRLSEAAVEAFRHDPPQPPSPTSPPPKRL